MKDAIHSKRRAEALSMRLYMYSLGAALRNQGVLSVPGFLSPLVDVQLSENAKTAWCVRGRRAQGLVPDLFLSHGRQAWRPTFLNAWVS